MYLFVLENNFTNSASLIVETNISLQISLNNFPASLIDIFVLIGSTSEYFGITYYKGKRGGIYTLSPSGTRKYKF